MRKSVTCVLCISAAAFGCGGCQTSKRPSPSMANGFAQGALASQASNAPASRTFDVQLASHSQPEASPEPLPTPGDRELESIDPAPKPTAVETLDDLESLAIAENPTLRRMEQEAAAEWDKTDYVAALPDPTISSMFYLPPMRFEPDRQVAEVQVMQMIPWLARLSAESQRAHVEALVAESRYQAERLRILGEVRANWFRLYVLGKQIEITEADSSQLESLIKTANARVATGSAQPGDVLLATLELSNLREQMLSYRQQLASAVAELNRLVGRESRVPISPPENIDATLPSWNHDLLRGVAFESQPELNAARLRTAATRWGIEIARLKRRPDVTVSGGWIAMDAPGALMPDAGADSWTVGVSTNLPIWHRKYDALVCEASREHFAAHASEDEVALRLDAMLRDLWEQALAAQQTVELYEKTILPQAKQAFEADQQSLVNNTVTFDRVIRDYRTILNLQIGYHRAQGQLATTIARIQQIVGVDLVAAP